MFGLLSAIIADGQSCFDTVDVTRRANGQLTSNGQMIFPQSAFSCNGRVTGYLVRLNSDGSSGGSASIHVWHPANSSFYTRVTTECLITAVDIDEVTGNNQGGGNDYYLGNVSCTENSIEFQSGDVIGYHQDNSVDYQLQTFNNNSYTYYHHNANDPLDTFNINSSQAVKDQPLIQVFYGKI